MAFVLYVSQVVFSHDENDSPYDEWFGPCTMMNSDIKATYLIAKLR